MIKAYTRRHLPLLHRLKNNQAGRHIRTSALFFFLVLLELVTISSAAAVYTVTPSTWNIIGLDSNRPASGPNRFPVGAKVCGGTPSSTDTASFTWETGGTDNGTYIYLRAGSANPVTILFGADGCADAYFEAEVAQTSLAFEQTRRFYITAGGVSTPRPRELYVEHLISQSRNAILNVELDGVSITAGGTMNLVVGNTYTIKLTGTTAPGGYNQFNAFINFSNTVFQILAVTTDYTANTSPYVSTTNHKYLYADACRWENDPNSPNYRSCLEDWKSGGTAVTTYTIKVLSGGGASETLSSLLFDLSGGSYHYNANYLPGGRGVSIIAASSVGISKNFTPDPTNVNGVSTLTFTLTNPNSAVVSALSFTDTFPSSPGIMKVATPPNASTSSCGTPTFSPVADATAISFANGTVAANSSCTVNVDVTTTATGTYSNTSNNLFAGATDTGNFASDTLTVNTTPPPTPPPSSCPGSEVELARWTMDPSQGTGVPPTYFSKAANVLTATASYTGTGANAIDTITVNPANSWSAAGWAALITGFPSATTAPYFDFVLDTSKYGGVRISSQHYIGSGDWAAPADNWLYIYSSANGGAFSTIYNALLPKGAWQTIPATTATTTGTSTTTFRINAVGAKDLTKPMYLDTIIFTGCAIPNPPTMTKSFAPSTVAVGATSTLTFTVTNPNASVAVSGVAFTDTLPAGLTVTSGSSVQCAGTLTRTAPSTLSFTGGTLAAGANCTVTATVTATTAGPHSNISGFVTSTTTGTNNAGASGIASASLTAVIPPRMSKLFSPNPILAGGTSTLTFSITNPNQNNAVSGVAFTDTFPISPAAMKVAAVPTAATSGCGTPTFAPVAAASSVSFSGGTIAAAGTCTVTVNITAPSVGTYSNTSGTVSHIINAASVNGNTASNSLTVNTPSPEIALLKQVGSSPTGPWRSFLAVTLPTSVYYKFTLENAGDVALSPVSVTDPLVSMASCVWPASLPIAVAANDNHIATCVVGPITAVAGSNLNTATASGTYSGTPYLDQSSATYATASLTIAKSATQTYFTSVGDVLNYSYLVTNNGSAILSGPVTVADNKTTVTCPALSTIGDNDNFFDPAESITCTASYTVVAADVTASSITNTASATSGGVTSPTVSKTVPRVTDLTASKSNNVGGQAQPGTPFDWTVMVINAASSGSATFADTQTLLTDDLPDSGATYAMGSVKTTGTSGTGTINCSITSNTLACTASGGTVTIPKALQGTVSVTNGSAAVTGSATSFTTQLTAGSIILINGTAYTVLSISSDTALTLTTNFSAATASGLTVPGSFSVPISVTPTAIGSLVNPRNGGICQADPLAVTPDTNELNNGCEDTVTVSSQPSITLLKSVSIISDPVNGASNPKFIPGAVAEYTIIASNSGGSADNNSTIITDAVPANTALYVNDLGGAGSGPVQFTQGATSSTLTYGFTALNNLTDDVDFSIDGGTTWNAVPVPASGVAGQPNVGCDLTINRIRINPKGTFIGNASAPNPSFQLKFRACVQ